jgi:hypothetical protein
MASAFVSRRFALGAAALAALGDVSRRENHRGRTTAALALLERQGEEN